MTLSGTALGKKERSLNVTTSRSVIPPLGGPVSPFGTLGANLLSACPRSKVPLEGAGQRGPAPPGAAPGGRVAVERQPRRP